MAKIVLKNIYKIYEDNTTAVEDFSLEIADHEFIVFVGPSGCGKSTTLRMIAGLEEISKGELYIGDRLMNDVAPKDRDIAMVFQNYALYPHMSVYKNMAFGLKLRKENRDDIDKKIHNAAKILGIEQYLDRKPRALSGGQRQRVALGRAMVREPSVFLLDEPLSNLDAKLRTSMRSEISKLHQRLDTTFIYVTHDQTEAMTMGDRICVMKDGLIQQTDTPKNLYEMPCNTFVAGFIGSPQMNFFDATLELENGKWYVALDSIKVKLPEYKTATLDKAYDKKEIILGVRPEHIVIGKSDNSLTARVELCEMLGAQTHLYLSFNNQKVIANINDTIQTQIGEPSAFSFEGKYAHLFDKQTEKSIIKY